MVRPLKRNQRTAVLGGVAAGLGDYFDVDPVLMRLGFVLLTFASAIGLLFYVICWVLMPTDDARGVHPSAADNVVKDVRAAGEKVASDVRAARASGRGQMIGGAVLVGLGLMLLADRFSWMFDWPYWLRFGNLWPLILVAIGVAMLMRSREEGA